MALLVRPSAINERTSFSRLVSAPSASSESRPDQGSDYLWVKGRSALGDALRRLEELGDVEHAILQQVPEPALGDEADRSRRLDVL